jgi:hypothetical protein
MSSADTIIRGSVGAYYAGARATLFRLLIIFELSRHARTQFAHDTPQYEVLMTTNTEKLILEVQSNEDVRMALHPEYQYPDITAYREDYPRPEYYKLGACAYCAHLPTTLLS